VCAEGLKEGQARRLLLRYGIGHTIPPWWTPGITDHSHRAKHPENLAVLSRPHVQGIKGEV
jgi:hypothetical protein